MFMLHDFMRNLHESSPLRTRIPFKKDRPLLDSLDQEHIRLEVGDKVHQVDQIIQVPSLSICVGLLMLICLWFSKLIYEDEVGQEHSSTGHLTA